MEGLKFAKNHEWVQLEDGTVKIGISDHAQSELGDIVFVELPEVGDDVEKGKSFSIIESVKVASDIYAPCNGKIVEVNQKLSNTPQLINEDAFGEGWIVKIEISDKNDLNDLMDEKEYKETI